MKYKRRIILVYVVVTYILVTLAINYGITNLIVWHGLATGLGLMLLAIPFHLMGMTHNRWYLVSFVLNSIGVGLSISTYYTWYNINPDLESMTLAALIGFLIILVFGIITLPKIVKPYVKGIVALAIIILSITSIVLWVQHDEVIYGLFFFYIHITCFYMVGMIISSNNIDHLAREISIISFSAFIVISIIVLIIISEGEALEGLDGLGGAFSDKKRKK